MYRKVKYLIPASDIDMEGISLKQALPTNNVEQVKFKQFSIYAVIFTALLTKFYLNLSWKKN